MDKTQLHALFANPFDYARFIPFCRDALGIVGVDAGSDGVLFDAPSQLNTDAGLFLHFFYNVFEGRLVEYHLCFFSVEEASRIVDGAFLQVSVAEFRLFMGVEHQVVVFCADFYSPTFHKDSCTLRLCGIYQKRGAQHFYFHFFSSYAESFPIGPFHMEECFSLQFGQSFTVVGGISETQFSLRIKDYFRAVRQ